MNHKKFLIAFVPVVLAPLVVPIVAHGSQVKAVDQECPSMEEQVEARVEQYKQKLEAELQDLRGKLKDQLSSENIDEMQSKLERLFDDMLKQIKPKDDVAKPKETVI